MDPSGGAFTVGFAGYHYDELTGFWYSRHRWYDPEAGRWLTRDPAGYVDGLSLYLYVGANPLAFIDPTGLAGVSFFEVLKQYPAAIGQVANERADIAQAALDVAGMAPAVGIVPDLINAGISTVRGNPGDAALSLAAAIPVIGQGVTGVKLIKRADAIAGGLKAADKIAGGVKNLDNAAGATKVVDKAQDVKKATDAGTDAAKNTGRGKNHLKPDPDAKGRHSVAKRDADGNVTGYETYGPPKNSGDSAKFRSEKRFDGEGDSHFNKKTGKKIDTPHVHDPNTPGGIREPTPKEIPKSNKCK